MKLVTIYVIIGTVGGRPDEINGEVTGYNYVFGLQLFRPFRIVKNELFRECVRECDESEECISLSYLKGMKNIEKSKFFFDTFFDTFYLRFFDVFL